MLYSFLEALIIKHLLMNPQNASLKWKHSRRKSKDSMRKAKNVMDLCSRKIVGYAYGTEMTADLAIQAVKNATLNVKDTSGILLHSDLGSQYTSQAFQEYVSKNGFYNFHRTVTEVANSDTPTILRFFPLYITKTIVVSNNGQKKGHKEVGVGATHTNEIIIETGVCELHVAEALGSQFMKQP